MKSIYRARNVFPGGGLCSEAVYAQTTDVKIEVNGLMTYDRAVIKTNPKEVVRIRRDNLKW